MTVGSGGASLAAALWGWTKQSVTTARAEGKQPTPHLTLLGGRSQSATTVAGAAGK